MQIEGSRILVTGASSGIGAALAPHARRAGATVGIVARRADRLEAVLAECREHAPDSRMWAADLGDLDRAERSRSKRGTRSAALDALVNNAGDPEAHAGARASPPADVAHVMDVELPLARAHERSRVLPKMLERGSGTIVFVSSMGGRIPIANEAAYNAAKFAMCGWSEAMCLDLARHRRRGEAGAARPDRHRDLGPARQRTRALRRSTRCPPPTARPASSPRIEDDGFEYYVPAEFPGGIGTQHDVVVNKTADTDAFVSMMGALDQAGRGDRGRGGQCGRAPRVRPHRQ